MTRLLFSCLTLFLTFTLSAAEPQDASPVDDKGRLSVFLDNDLFGDTDQNYTNGVRLSWLSANKNLMEDVGGFQRPLRLASGGEGSWPIFQALTGFDDLEKVRYNYGFSLTQLMFTPRELEPTTPLPDQRPYAGWLGFGLSLHAKDDKILNSVSLNVGITGRHSFAHDAQDIVHDARNFARFNGWDNQLPTELTLNIFFDQKRYWRPVCLGEGELAADVFTEWGFAAGNFRTNAYVGAVSRIGFNLPVDFSDPRLSPTSFSNKFGNVDYHNWHSSFYLLGGMRLTAVAHDITLDGPVFRGGFDTNVDREIMVGEGFLGFGFRWKRLEISYAQTWRSREFDKQKAWHSFGSLMFSLAF